MASPQDSVLNIGIGFDPKEAVSGAKVAKEALGGVEQAGIAAGKGFDHLGTSIVNSMRVYAAEIKSAEENTISFNNILTTTGKIATSALGIVTTVLKAPVDLDNYLGTLNQKVTQVGGNLQSYKETFSKFLTEFKPGQGGFGLGEEEYKKIMMQFATGTTAVEKLGAAREASLTGYTGGAGMMTKLMGFDPSQAAMLLTDLRKTVGLLSPDMEPFSKTMGNIGKSANMSSGSFYKLTQQVTKLAKAYNLNGEAGQKFVIESLKVGAALSQIGLDAEKTMKKMNEISTGSEKGLIQSLLLGFNPNDPQGQLKAFENQAKMIVTQAASAGEQFAPLVTRMMADAMGMEGFSVEDINRMASGARVEGKDRPATEILQEISDTLKNPARVAEAPYLTVAQAGQTATNTLIKLVIDKFSSAIPSLKDFLITTIPGMIGKIGGWIDKFIAMFGQFDLKKLAGAAVAIAAIPVALKLVLQAFATALEKILMKHAVASTAGNVLGGLVGKFVGGLAGLAAPIIIGVVTGLIAKGIMDHVADTIDKKGGKEKQGKDLLAALDLQRRIDKAESVGDTGAADRARGALNRLKTDPSTGGLLSDFGEGTAGSIPVTPSKGGISSFSSDDVKRMTLDAAKAEGFTASQTEAFYGIIERESKFNPKVAKGAAGELGVGQIMPAMRKAYKLSDSQALDPAANLKVAAKIFKEEINRFPGQLEKSVQAYNAGGTRVSAGTANAASRQYARDVMNRVHDEEANSHLSDIKNYLQQLLGVPGSPTSNKENTGLIDLFGH